MIRKKLYLLLLCSLNIHPEVPKDRDKILAQLAAYDGVKTFFLSYPRSANTWTRYCAEYCTQRPSLSRNNWQTINIPLGWTAGFEVDVNKPPIEKVHTSQQIRYAKGSPDNDYLVLIVRNPKEVFIRQIGKEKLLNVVNGKPAVTDISIYFDNLETFMRWNPEKRLLLRYEEILNDPVNTLLKLLNFLNEPIDRLQIFMQNYEYHRKKAIAIYEESASGGDDIFYHSKKMSKEECKQVDVWIEKKYPALWKSFLKDWYSEGVINSSGK